MRSSNYLSVITHPHRFRHGPIVLIILIALMLTGCSKPDPALSTPGQASAERIATYPDCEKPMPGQAGASDEEISTDGIAYSVRTPSNYQPSKRYPLIMVWAPAGFERDSTEQFTRLTPVATQAGFIIAYPDHRRMALETFPKLARIPTEIAQKWCINRNRVYYTGHSDGGLTSNALSFLPELKDQAAAIAPSAAGIRGEDLQAYDCPKPLSVMVMHNKKDRLFAGFGEQAAAWWAACNKCDPEPTEFDETGCRSYQNCEPGIRTLFCESEGGHSRWPAREKEIIKFFTP